MSRLGPQTFSSCPRGTEGRAPDPPVIQEAGAQPVLTQDSGSPHSPVGVLLIRLKKRAPGLRELAPSSSSFTRNWPSLVTFWGPARSVQWVWTVGRWGEEGGRRLWGVVGGAYLWGSLRLIFAWGAVKPHKTQAVGGVLGKEGWESGSLAKGRGLAPRPLNSGKPLSGSSPHLARYL